MYKNPNRHIVLYIQNVPWAPIALFNTGNVNVRIKDAIQSESVAIDMANPRILFGKISDNTTQVMGANEVA